MRYEKLVTQSKMSFKTTFSLLANFLFFVVSSITHVKLLTPNQNYLGGKKCMHTRLAGTLPGILEIVLPSPILVKS